MARIVKKEYPAMDLSGVEQVVPPSITPVVQPTIVATGAAQAPPVDLKKVFVYARKVDVTTSVPQSIYDIMQAYPGGTGAFLESAIRDFSGSLTNLLYLAADFEHHRKARRKAGEQAPAINGKVTVEAHNRVLAMEKLGSEQGVERLSKSKLVAGFIQAKLQARTKVNLHSIIMQAPQEDWADNE